MVTLQSPRLQCYLPSAVIKKTYSLFLTAFHLQEEDKRQGSSIGLRIIKVYDCVRVCDRVKKITEADNNCHCHSDEDREGCCQGSKVMRLACLEKKKKINLAYTLHWAMAQAILVIE